MKGLLLLEPVRKLLFLPLGAVGGIKFKICRSQEDEEPGLEFTVSTVWSICTNLK